MRTPFGHGPGRHWRRYVAWLAFFAATLGLYAASWVLLLRLSS